MVNPNHLEEIIMRTQTKTYKLEQMNDICTLKQRNNSKDAKRTAEQIEQSKQARVEHYLAKWTKMLEAAETQTQKTICKNMLYGLK